MYIVAASRFGILLNAALRNEIHYLSSPRRPVQVIFLLLKMLTTTSTAAMPSGTEAKRILGFFMSSLANRQLNVPANVAEMVSWTVLTPCYEEDVLYPLDAHKEATNMGKQSNEAC